jgi:hypothetical protein
VDHKNWRVCQLEADAITVVIFGIVRVIRPVKRISKRVPNLLQCQDHDTYFVMKGCYP